MMKFVLSLASLVFILFVSKIFASEICFSTEEAKKVLIELKESKVCKEIVTEEEKIIENLKKQNELLRKQNDLLKEIVEIERNKTELYRVAYEEEKKKSGLSFFKKIEYFSLGVLGGILIGVFGL